MNLQKMMKQAQAMQQKMEEAQAEVAAMEVEGTAGGGMVKVTMTGGGETKALNIDPKMVDPDDVEMLEDLIIAALNDAKKKADEESARVMGGVTSGMQLPPGMKMPF